MILSDLSIPPPQRGRSVALALTGCLLLFACCLGGCSKNSSSDTSANAADGVVARVNGVDIKQSDLALAEEDVGADIQGASPEAKREHLIAYLADIIMVTQAADKKNVSDNPDFKRRLAFLRNKLLMGFELQEEANPPSATRLCIRLMMTRCDPAAARRCAPGTFWSKTKTRRSQFSISSRAAAISRRLQRRNRKTRARPTAGTSAISPREQMVPEFAEVAFKMYPANCPIR
jgi:peptidyl-prolyl cis-trans isomerase C